MNNSQRFINIILSIILIFAIILTTLSGIIRFPVTNKGIYLRLLEDSNTYSNIEQALSNKMVSILGNDISENLKNSIITTEDIKKEANVVLDCIISDLISGQPNIPEIDTTIYKERIAAALNTLAGFEDNTKKDKSLTSDAQIYGDYLTPITVSNIEEKLVSESKFNVSKLNNNKNNNLILVNIATRAEIEAKGRAILKSKGITEEEARRKAALMGITEEDVWNYLEANGYLDEKSENGKSSDSEDQKDINLDNPVDSSNSTVTKNTYSNDEVNADTQSDESDNYNNKNDEGKVSKKKIQEIISSVMTDNSKNLDEKINEISSKLMEEADKIINAEMEKLNFSKFIDSNKFKTAIKVTSALYNNFYVLLLSVAVICSLIFWINKGFFGRGFIIIGRSILLSGIIMSLILGSVYLFKLYNHININLNKAYFEPMFLETAKYFSKLLFELYVVILFLGLIINIFMRKSFIRR